MRLSPLALCAVAVAATAESVTPIASSAQLRCDTTQEQRDGITDRALDELRRLNYTVEEGVFEFLGNSTIEFGANPSNPYGVYTFGGLPAWQLGPQDAVVFVGCTPPKAAYFSWRSYVFGQFPLDILFASLGDSLNNLVLGTTAPAGESPAERTLAVVTTADRATAQTVRFALSNAGLPPQAINVDEIPPSLVNMGREPFLDDSFVMLHRASVFEDQELRALYFKQERPVYRVYAPEDGPSPNPFPIAPLRPVGTGRGEADIPGLSAALSDLVRGATEAWDAKGYELYNTEVLDELELDGFDCIRDKTNCLGDNRDVPYLKIEPREELESDQVHVLIGTNSVATEKCSYTNFGIYYLPSGDLGTLTATTLSLDHRTYVGSAKHLVPSLPDEQAERLFAWAIQRECGDDEPFCLEVDYDEMPRDVFWAVAYRPYLEPATATGPSLDEIQAPTLLSFRRKQQQQQ